MTQRLYSLMFLLLCMVTATAQIQRKILDFTLGVTTKAQVLNYLKNHHYKYLLRKNGEYVASNITFAGYNWQDTYFSFYKGKLYCVDFRDDGEYTPEELLKEVWERLKNSLNSKYSIYSISSKDNKIEFSDNKTYVGLGYEYSFGSKSLSIMYFDIYLFKQCSKSEYNEL